MIDCQQKRFLSSLAAILGKMANADGVVTGDEVASVGEIWQKLGLTPEQSLYCTEEFNKAADDNEPLEKYAEEYVASAYGASTKSLLYALLWEVACADGILHRNEVRALKNLVEWLGVRKESFEIYYSKYVTYNDGVIDEEKEEIRKRRAAEKRAREEREKREAEERSRRAAEETARCERERKRKEADQRRAEAERRKREEAERQRRAREKKAREDSYRRTPLDRAYAILGCSASDSDEKVRKAFHILALKSHPDSMSRDGVSPGILAQITARMAEINDAWALIRKARGI